MPTISDVLSISFKTIKDVGTLSLVPAIAILLSVSASGAGEVEKTSNGVCDFTYSGQVDLNDLEKIRLSGIAFGSGLCLDSPGGVFIEGVRIAEWLVEAGVKTVIAPGASCYSACAIAFMGGGFFEDAYFPQRELYAGGQLGFHAPYPVTSVKNYTSEELSLAYHFGLESVAKMMTLGMLDSNDKGFIPTSVILELLKMPPNKLYMINTGARIRKLSIDYKGLNPMVWENRDIMNACSSVMGEDGSSKSPSQNPAMKIQNAEGSLDLWYEGYGAEASGFCVFRSLRDGTKMVAVPVWDSDDLIDSTFVPITEADALTSD
ncbi:MAG: hypothetical protein CMP81_10255 [Fulvimarina sp.]|nr:hypothetical protein [Fulvimarina sp.]